MSQLINELEKHIIRIFDENNNEIKFDIVNIKIEKRKFSSIASPILYINNIALTCKQMKTYKVEYIYVDVIENILFYYTNIYINSI